jgi:hypothetical protein
VAEPIADLLNEFLRQEMSAVESYREALTRLTDPVLRMRVIECLRSHGMRVDTLLDEIDELGGSASGWNGAWHGFENARALSEDDAVAILEAGEEQILARYRRDMRKLDADTQELVEMELLPEQERTFTLISSLKAVKR